MIFIWTIITIIILVLSITYLKLPPFVAFILASIFTGVVLGLQPEPLFKAIQEGTGSTLGSIAAIIALGSILGKWIGLSGAAQQITQSLLALSGPKYVRFAFMVAGFLVGLPLFYSVAFILLAPLVITASEKQKIPATYLAIPMLSSLTVTQGYLPPHPAPLAIMQELGADMGKTLGYGILIAIPAILISGALFGLTVKNIKTLPNPAFIFTELQLEKGEKRPHTALSFILILLPIVLIALGTFLHKNSFLSNISDYIANPTFALFISVIVSWISLRRLGFSKNRLHESALQAIKDVAGILLIFGGAGALKQVLVVGGVSQAVSDLMSNSSWNLYVIGWTMAAIIRVCVGSSTVAGITAAGFIKVFVQNSTIDPNLMVLALGAGSMMFSHVNDTGFWLFREYFQLNLKDTLRSWTMMDTLVSITGLLGVLVLDIWV